LAVSANEWIASASMDGLGLINQPMAFARVTKKLTTIAVTTTFTEPSLELINTHYKKVNYVYASCPFRINLTRPLVLSVSIGKESILIELISFDISSIRFI
jgi:hypothetical protein